MGFKQENGQSLGLRSLERNVLLGFALAAAVLLLIGVLAFISVVRFSADARQVDHTHQVLNALSKLRNDLTAAESSQRGFLLTNDETFRQTYDAAADSINQQFAHIREFTHDNSTQQHNLDALAPLIADRLALLHSHMEIRGAQGSAAAQGGYAAAQGNNVRESILKLIGNMEDQENQLLQQREQQTEFSSLLTRAAVAAGALLALLLVVAAFLVVRQGFERSRGAEEDLRQARNSLEQGVQERTAELIKTGAAVRAGEERLFRIIESALDAIITIDDQQRITMFNPAAEKMFACPAGEAIGTSLERFIPERFRQAHAGHMRTFDLNSATRRSMGGFRPLAGLRANGEEFPIEASISEVEINGSKLYTAIVRDVSEAAKAWESSTRLAAIVESSTDAIISKTLDGTILSWNPAAERLFGYTSAEAVGKPILLIVPRELAHEEESILDRVAKGEKIEHYETRRMRKDGKQLDIALTVSPLRDSSGRVIGASKIARDITAVKRAEALQIRSQKLEALGTLAGGIAHDFNNVLTAINGSAAIAVSQLPVDHPAQTCLAAIEKAGRRAADLVRRILTFSRPQEQNMQVQALEPIVVEALKLVRSTLPARVEIRSEFASGVPKTRVDSTQVYQIIVNLATNAAHAIGDKPGLIQVKLDERTIGEQEILLYSDVPAGHYTRLSVSDNGCGMDAPTLQRIFDPFFSTKPTGVGTGLGLSVVHGIVTAHHGILKVYSEPEKGTTFHIYFPAVNNASAPARPPDRQIPLGRGERILFVDDEGVLLFIGTMTLEQNGYKVTGMPSGEAALEELQQNANYDVVITDLSMPGISGLQLAAEIHELRADLPVILTSGYINPDDQGKADKLGFHAVLTKPVNTTELLSTLAALFEGRNTIA